MKACHTKFSRPIRRRQGFALIELVLAGTILVIAVVGTVGSITSSAMIGDSTREITRAQLAAGRVVEQMLSMNARDAFAMYNANPADDPVGGAPGAAFDVPGLAAFEGDVDGRVGEIRFPTLPRDPGIIRENRFDPEFGLPRDLNGNGAINGGNRANDFLVLPVRVEVVWSGRGGRKIVTLETTLWAR